MSQHYVLRKDNQFFDKNGEFKAPAARHESAVQFATEDAALDQAEALGLHLDTIRVMVVRHKTKAD
jgi:hypothetical protein